MNETIYLGNGKSEQQFHVYVIFVLAFLSKF